MQISGTGKVKKQQKKSAGACIYHFFIVILQRIYVGGKIGE